MCHSNDLPLPLRDLCESLLSFEAALIPSPLRLSFEAP